ncbi:MAG: ATP-binding cassette domain-containing protein [Oscillospiraceae bacterium]|nr:ATP-binding cassette domain-containing protein [Clostridia bacterium]MBR0311297.1 ATP-binding cassette domain-containing protein [Oscillospiraceae bacterium]
MLELKHISYVVGDKVILNDVNLKTDDRFVAITGPNGSGKSTLVKIIMGLITPTAGQVIFNGEDITGDPINVRADKGISFAFQQPVRFKGLRVGDLLKLAYRGEKNVVEACEILRDVGLDPRLYRDRELNDTLSGGEMKRIEIAMAAARGSALSLFDEPEAGIDLWSFQSLIRIFEALYAKTAGSILIISHQERILNIADKIIYLKNGTVECFDERDAVLSYIAAVQKKEAQRA